MYMYIHVVHVYILQVDTLALVAQYRLSRTQCHGFTPESASDCLGSCVVLSFNCLTVVMNIHVYMYLYTCTCVHVYVYM